MDGQLSGAQAAMAVQSMASAEARECWHVYHLVGDVLRSTDLAACGHDTAFVARLAARLQHETSAFEALPALAKPAMLDVARPAANDGVFRWKLVAGLASFAAVAAIGWGALGSIGLGILGGLSGIWWGMRRYLRAPIDALERRQLLRYGFAMSLLVVGFTVCLVLSNHWPGWQAPVLVSVVYMSGVMLMATRWMPRILARRHAQEAARDPVAAQAARRKERRNAWIGCTLGLAFGIGALVFGLIATGRL